MNQMQIRSHFTGWHDVSREEGARYVKTLMGRLVHPGGKEEREKYIEERFVRGATVKELLAEQNGTSSALAR